MYCALLSLKWSETRNRSSFNLLENAGKCWKMLKNLGKSWKMLGNVGAGLPLKSVKIQLLTALNQRCAELFMGLWDCWIVVWILTLMDWWIDGLMDWLMVVTTVTSVDQSKYVQSSMPSENGNRFEIESQSCQICSKSYKSFTFREN